MIDTIKKIGLGMKNGASTIADLFKYISNSKFWWLAPMLAALLICGVALVVVNTVTTTMPFVYALF